MESNETLLREGECPHFRCIEAAGHDGPHSLEPPALDIAAAKKRCEAATEGPWQAVGFDGLKEGANYHDFSIVASQIGDEDIFITNIGPFFCPVEVSKEQAADEWATGDFIAHARTDLPAALEGLEEAQGKLDAVEEFARTGCADIERDGILRILRGTKEDE